MYRLDLLHTHPPPSSKKNKVPTSGNIVHRLHEGLRARGSDGPEGARGRGGPAGGGGESEKGPEVGVRWVELFEELPVRDGVAARSPPAVHFHSAVRIVVALLLPVPSRADNRNCAAVRDGAAALSACPL